MTLNYFVRNKWHNLNQHTVNGSNPQPANKRLTAYFSRGTELRITRKEFFNWCAQQWGTIKLLKRPSLDRIDSNGHYELNNMRIIELSDNASQGGKILGMKFADALAKLPTRHCLQCGNVLVRKLYGTRADRKNASIHEGSSFASRKFCGRSCSASYMNHLKWGNSDVTPIS